MRALIVAVLIVAVPVSGCLQDVLGSEISEILTGTPEDRSSQTLTITVNASGQFEIAVPLPVVPDIITPDDWARNVTSPDDVDARLEETEHGVALVLTGTGMATVRSTDSEAPQQGNRCCAEAFLDAEWTTSEGNRTHTWFHVEGGSLSVRMEYEAKSKLCGGGGEVDSRSLDSGWTLVEASIGGGSCA